MLPIKKFTIGIRPDKKMFRVQSTWGEIADKVFSHVRKDKDFDRSYFEAVRTSDARDSVTIISKEPGNSLTVTMQDIVFIKDSYESGRPIDRKQAQKEFLSLWRVVDSILHVSQIRRIGVVGEGRIDDVENPSLELLKGLTELGEPKHPAKFLLKYEERTPTMVGLAPDMEKDDFKNTIYHLYDSVSDTEHAIDNGMSFTVDYQRYFAPPTSGSVAREVDKLSGELEAKWRKFSEKLDQLGVRSA